MTKNERTITCTIKFTPEELREIDHSWKYTEGFLNRTQYFRAAINHYAGKEICSTR